MVPSYEKTFERDPATPPIVIATLRPVPVPGGMLERTAESLKKELEVDALTPIDTAATKEENPNPLPNNT